ncbi:MAG TPA: MarR family transcriptional regulator [Acetobacteraceae bacterium]|nr:MarR family transcriptional regulator [Acetobacteraceae bacterium]
MSTTEAVSFETTRHVRATCLCLHLQQAARAIARRFDDCLRPTGLTNGQFSLLMALNRPEPPTMSSVATLLAMDRTTLTASVKPLERRNLLRVVVDPVDRRSRRLILTRAGKAALNSAYPLWQREHARLDGLVADPQRVRDDLQALSGTASTCDGPNL